MSFETAINILHNELSVIKLSARQVLELLTVDSRIQLSVSKQCWNFLSEIRRSFYVESSPLLETWTHYNTPDMKSQSK